MDSLSRLIKGSIDMHIHSSPSLFPRRIDHVESARLAEEAGMRAIVVKCHHHSTAPDVVALHPYALKDLKVQVFGSVALNGYEGGLNPYMVDLTLRMGGKVVWFPTISSANHIRHHQAKPNMKFPSQDRKPLQEVPIPVMDERGELLPASRQILGMIAEAGAVMSPGHLSPGEALALIQGARETGVKRVLVNHPEFAMEASEAQVQEFVRLGAYIEHSIGMYHPESIFYEFKMEQLIRWIELSGPERTLLCSDLGQKNNPLPVEAMRWAAGQLLDRGVREADLELMMKKNAAWLLGLED